MKTNLLITERDKSLRTLQLIELEGLKEIDRICRKYKIDYSLGGGTCLGQLRHNGFIPWDDDIDVDMTIENYDKFVKVCETELDGTKFFLRSRKTDNKYLRSCSRLEILNTNISLKKWRKNKIKVGIFVDIFVWNFLPNEESKRKKFASKLFYIRCIENYKMFKTFAKKVDPKKKFYVYFFAKFVPYKLILKWENKLVNQYTIDNSKWIIDDAIINGDHGGYSSEGIVKYKDVLFENLKIINKKDPHNFMKTIYGEKYMEWLPTYKRISHHLWDNIDFGPYKEFFDAPDNYNDLLTISYSNVKLEQMKKVSLDMISDLDTICNKYDINYYLLGEDANIKFLGIDDYGRNWRAPLKVGMIREDYEKFLELNRDQIGYKYFLETRFNDDNYKYSYSRFCLNFTSIRDSNISKELHEKMKTGFYIKIIPLDKTSNNLKLSLKQMKKIRRINSFISIKWKKMSLSSFIKGNIKFKIKYLLLKNISFNSLFNKLKKIQNMYNDTDSNYYVDGSGYQFEGIVFDKNILGKGKFLNYLGHKVKFPSNEDLYLEKYVKSNKIYNKLLFIKKEFPKSYLRYVEIEMLDDYKNVSKKFGPCYLTYYDIPEYQLTVLRYDEKEDRLLSNEELISRYEREEKEKENNL